MDTNTRGRPAGRLLLTSGAFFIVALENYLAPFGQWVLVIQGAIFVVCVLLFRRGIVGEFGGVLGIRL